MSRSAVFIVRLSRASSLPITMNYQTAPGTAVSPSDFTSKSGQIQFSSGETIKQIIIPVRDDIPGGIEEQFTLNISNAVNANISDSEGVCVLPGTPVNTQPVVNITNITVASL